MRSVHVIISHDTKKGVEKVEDQKLLMLLLVLLAVATGFITWAKTSEYGVTDTLPNGRLLNCEEECYIDVTSAEKGQIRFQSLKDGNKFDVTLTAPTEALEMARAISGRRTGIGMVLNEDNNLLQLHVTRGPENHIEALWTREE